MMPMAPAVRPASSVRSRGRSRLRVAVLVGALLAVALLGTALLLALSAKASLESARGQLDALTSEELLAGDEAIETLRSASQEVQSARRQLDNPVVRLVAGVPLLGRSWDAEASAGWISAARPCSSWVGQSVTA